MLGEVFYKERMLLMAEKKRKERNRSTLTSTQEVLYNREFKMADRAGGFLERKSR